MDEDFRYGKELEAAFEACPMLRSVEPESVRVFLAGYITGQQLTIEDLLKRLAEVQPLVRLVSVTDKRS